MTVNEHVKSISLMSADERKAEWTKTFKSPPPAAFGAGLLARALAAHAQEKVYGALTKSELRRLQKLHRDAPGPGRSRPASDLEPGTMLSRSWHGEVHEVLVLEGGFAYRGCQYSSLTVIAKQITGAVWSGPRFFGLHSPRLKRVGSG